MKATHVSQFKTILTPMNMKVDKQVQQNCFQSLMNFSHDSILELLFGLITSPKRLCDDGRFPMSWFITLNALYSIGASLIIQGNFQRFELAVLSFDNLVTLLFVELQLQAHPTLHSQAQLELSDTRRDTSVGKGVLSKAPQPLLEPLLNKFNDLYFGTPYIVFIISGHTEVGPKMFHLDQL
ncbi:hypothetical protein BC830DRAFT_1177113 [Chytriomyces sp. MP71]|nr:hypothetical protein BC830DRAFT_1177113 [Chytriomyces sp. MP71]